MLPGDAASLVEGGVSLDLLWERLTGSDDGNISTSDYPGAAGDADGDSVGTGRRGEEDSFSKDYFSVEGLRIADSHEYVKSCIEHCVEGNKEKEDGIYGKVESLHSLEECSKVHSEAVKNLNIRYELQTDLMKEFKVSSVNNIFESNGQHLQSVAKISYNDKPLSYCERSMSQPRTHEFELLMSHTLADLEEVLPCSSRVFDCLSEHQQQPAKFFIIHEKCYLIDPPDDSNTQVSDWALRFAQSRTKFSWQQLKANSITIGSLPLTCGQAIYFCHAGCCVHPLVMTDLFLTPVSAKFNYLMKPLVTTYARGRRSRCQACSQSTATTICTANILAASEPCMLCDVCYHMLHYKSDCTLQYSDFRVYPTSGA
eukprot:446528_1